MPAVVATTVVSVDAALTVGVGRAVLDLVSPTTVPVRGALVVAPEKGSVVSVPPDVEAVVDDEILGQGGVCSGWKHIQLPSSVLATER